MFIDNLVHQIYCVNHHVTYEDEEFPETLQFNYNKEPKSDIFEDRALLF